MSKETFFAKEQEKPFIVLLPGDMAFEIDQETLGVIDMLFILSGVTVLWVYMSKPIKLYI